MFCQLFKETLAKETIRAKGQRVGPIHGLSVFSLGCKCVSI